MIVATTVPACARGVVARPSAARVGAALVVYRTRTRPTPRAASAILAPRARRDAPACFVEANETAKDFAYIDGLMQAASHHRCRRGPGAKKGLALVRAERAGGGALGGVDDARDAPARQAARGGISGWVETIDVEQALASTPSTWRTARRGRASKRYARAA